VGQRAPILCLGQSGGVTAMAGTGARPCEVMAGTTSAWFGGQMTSNSSRGKWVGSSLEGTQTGT
jgi:hypothetical protein